MKYELTHDTIARQVYQKASTEARTRRKVERYIREHYADYQDRGVQLTQDDIDYVWPYLDQVNSPEEEINFLKNGKSRLLRKRRVRQILWGTITAAFAVLALWAFQQRNQAVEREQQSQSMRISLAARYALYEGKPGLAFRLAEQTLLWDNDENAKAIATEVLQEIQDNPLVRDIEHKGIISVLQFSLDGKLILSASEDGEVRLSSLKGEIVHSFSHDSPIIWASLLSNDQHLAVQTAAHELLIYDLQYGTKERLALNGPVTAVSAQQTKSLLSAAVGDKILVWALSSDNAKLLLEQATGTPLSTIELVTFKGSWEIITADESGNIFRWNQQGEKLTIYPNVLSQPITGMTINERKDKVVFRTPEGDFLTTYEGDTLETTRALLFRGFQPTGSVFSGKDTIDRLVALSRDSALVYVYNFASKSSNIDLSHSPKTTAHCGVLSPDGKIVLMGSADNEAVVSYLKDAELDQNYTLFRFNSSIVWGVFAPNNAHFLSSADGRKALLWKLDPEYVTNKKAISTGELIQYYQTRLRPLNKEEQLFYQLDDLN